MSIITIKMSYDQALSAIRKNDYETIKKYLKKRQISEPLINDWSDYTLLLKALNQRRERIACLLLENGCRLNRPVQSNSPLHIAVLKQCKLYLIKELLIRGAQINGKNRKGETALHLAFNNQCNNDVIDLLLEYSLKNSAMNLFDKQGLSYLHIACSRLNVQNVKRLVDDGKADVNCKVAYDTNSEYAGCTPLHFAVENNRIEIAEVLLTYGANIYCKDEHGSTPLHFAVEHCNTAMIDLLLMCDSKRKNVVNRFGVSHFMAACAGTDKTIVEKFIEKAGPSSTAMINEQINPGSYDYFYPNSGYTPLHFAAEYGRIEIIRLLLDLGADCCVLTVHGLSSHNLALGNHHMASLDLIEAHCSDKLYQSLLKGHYENSEQYFLPINKETSTHEIIITSSFKTEVSTATFEYLVSPMDMDIDFKPSSTSTPIKGYNSIETVDDLLSNDYRSVNDCESSYDNIEVNYTIGDISDCLLNEDELAPFGKISQTFLNGFDLKSSLV